MSQEQIEQFYQLVQQDTVLQEQLKTVDNLESGLKLVTELAKEKGYIFTTTQLKEWITAKSLIGSENAEEELSEESFNLLYSQDSNCISCHCDPCSCMKLRSQTSSHLRCMSTINRINSISNFCAIVCIYLFMLI